MMYPVQIETADLIYFYIAYDYIKNIFKSWIENFYIKLGEFDVNTLVGGTLPSKTATGKPFAQ